MPPKKNVDSKKERSSIPQDLREAALEAIDGLFFEGLEFKGGKWKGTQLILDFEVPPEENATHRTFYLQILNDKREKVTRINKADKNVLLDMIRQHLSESFDKVDILELDIKKGVITIDVNLNGGSPKTLLNSILDYIDEHYEDEKRVDIADGQTWFTRTKKTKKDSSKKSSPIKKTSPKKKKESVKKANKITTKVEYLLTFIKDGTIDKKSLERQRDTLLSVLGDRLKEEGYSYTFHPLKGLKTRIDISYDNNETSKKDLDKFIEEYIDDVDGFTTNTYPFDLTEV